MNGPIGRSWRAVLSGGRKGVATSWELLRVIAPAYVVVTALGHTPALDWIARAFQPIMGLLGLRGEGALVLVLGNVLGMYAGIGAMASLAFTPRELAVLSLMLSFSHSLVVETAVTHKLGLSVWSVVVYRLGLAVTAALVLHLIWGWIGGVA